MKGSPNILPIVMFVLLAGTLIFRFLKFGGFKAAMFKSGIERTEGQVSGAGSGIMNVALKVHKLDGRPERAVGLELVAKSFASYQMLPISLSVEETKNLIALLESAIRK